MSDLKKPKVTKNTVPNLNQLLINAEVTAKMLGISVATLWKHKACGKIPEPVKIAGSTRWVHEEIRSWVAARCPDPASWNPPQNDVDC